VGRRALYCSYNQFFKIDSAILRAWGALLASDTAGASLVMVKFMFHEHAAPRLARLLQGLGAADGQLVMADKASTAEHIARSSLMDLHLDTRLQSGHTTTVDAIWSGIPVLVFPARSMVSRAAAGIVIGAGMPWTVARTAGDYVELAQRIVARVPMLKEKVAAMRTTSPLFDIKAWVKDFERALRLAFESRCFDGGGCVPNSHKSHVIVARTVAAGK